MAARCIPRSSSTRGTQEGQHQAAQAAHTQAHRHRHHTAAAIHHTAAAMPHTAAAGHRTAAEHQCCTAAWAARRTEWQTRWACRAAWGSQQGRFPSARSAPAQAALRQYGHLQNAIRSVPKGIIALILQVTLVITDATGYRFVSKTFQDLGYLFIGVNTQNMLDCWGEKTVNFNIVLAPQLDPLDQQICHSICRDESHLYQSRVHASDRGSPTECGVITPPQCSSRTGAT